MREPAHLRACALAALSALALVSCGDGEKKHRGIELMPDMFDSPTYRRQVAEVVPAGISSDHQLQEWPSVMPPVPGTVSREVTPYPIAAADFASAAKLVDPLAPTAAVLREGQYRFNIYCVVCHGRDGDAANGYVAKYFSGVPGLNSIHISQMSDGELFHIITMGRGRMPNYAAQVPASSRWAVVQYVRCLNRAALAALDIDKQLAVDEKATKDKPEDGNLKAAVAADRAAAAQRKRDLAAIVNIGERDARSFEPLSEPRPEYEEPSYPTPSSEQEKGK